MVETANLSPEEKTMVDLLEKDAADREAELAYAIDTGREEGRADGLDQGRAEGRAEGREEGAADYARSVARAALAKGLDLQDIGDLLGMGKTEAEALIRDLT
jgi:predicted transposase YdaD